MTSPTSRTRSMPAASSARRQRVTKVPQQHRDGHTSSFVRHFKARTAVHADLDLGLSYSSSGVPTLPSDWRSTKTTCDRGLVQRRSGKVLAELVAVHTPRRDRGNSFRHRLRSPDVPFTCGVCGAGRDLVQVPARGTTLYCPQCGDERPFFRPPLLVVTGTSGVGKSTLCARLAGKIAGAVLLDADIFASDMVSVVAPNADYPAFWRSMARLAHEIAQNNLAVVFFSVMLPQQLLANTDVLGYFESVSFLCLTCDAEVLRTRFMRRVGVWTDTQSIEAAVDRWSRFNGVLKDAAHASDQVHVIDATRSVGEVEGDVRAWILARLQRCS